jgi:hypothetical protein
MSGWVKDAANKIREEKERQKANEEYQRKLAETLAANAPAVFDKLLLQVEQDVQEFNKEFSAPEQRLDFERLNDISFRVSRTRGWAFILTVALNRSSATIMCETQRPNTVDGQLYSTGDSFRVEMVGTDPVLSDGSKIVSYEEASKKLLLPALEYFA